MDSIAILDFGSQYSQLIARRVREAHVYCELFPYSADPDEVLRLQPAGFILSGGPASVYEAGAPQIPAYVLASGKPILGICYGMQALTHSLGGVVAASAQREYGPAEVETSEVNPLLPAGRQQVWMSHGDRIERLPPGFRRLAMSAHSPIAAMADAENRRFGIQFHPEVRHTPGGSAILRAFAVEVCGAHPDWTPASIVATAVEQIRLQIGAGEAVAGVSGGVDSSVAAALVGRAIGDQLHCIFVNTGMLRQDEPEQVVSALRPLLTDRLLAIDATESFLEALAGVTDPEDKRRIIGEEYAAVLEEGARSLGDVQFLAQGTLYPDVIESGTRQAARIKTHHNVGGLPETLKLQLVEPVRYLFKDEVRAVGEELDLPGDIVWRHPFPGPGLAIRILGEVTPAGLHTLREADAVIIEESREAGLYRRLFQCFAVLAPVKSVGVMGDQRTYASTIILRAVVSEDAMTADFAELPYEVLSRISTRVTNEVPGVNRVVYDISSKPPATIEWE